VLQRAPDEAARDAAIARSARASTRGPAGRAAADAGAQRARRAPRRFERADLSELVRQRGRDIVPLAHARGSTLELFADERGRRARRPGALSALARNLADNAVRYSPPGSRVELRVAAMPVRRRCRSTTRPRHSARRARHVFDRFYRRAEQHEPGTGLGLAIVRGVAERHGATVELGDSPLGGLRVTVRFRAPN
jgi:two-component system OmpR family sensor kinase/two-component system sensor histidine kinase QseC